MSKRTWIIIGVIVLLIIIISVIIYFTSKKSSKKTNEVYKEYEPQDISVQNVNPEARLKNGEPIFIVPDN